MFKFVLVFVACATFLIVNAYSVLVSRTYDDVGLTTYELIDKHGYEFETHNVQTEDGYILEMIRITGLKGNAKSDIKKPPVLMMHGILSSAADWVNVGPKRALAYKLVNEGFDVWLGNARGTTLSRKHATLNPDSDKQFWNFTWNEIGYYDLPAMIDYILSLTNHEQLQYVGFSQGTTVFFVMASERPEYNAKIKLFSALAPVAIMTHYKNPVIKLAAKYNNIIALLLETFDIHELLSFSEMFTVLGRELCDDGKPTQELCNIFMWTLVGYDREKYDPGFLPVITSNGPAGMSSKQLMHYLQLIKNGGLFRKYLDETSKVEPAEYDLTKITAPVALYYGENDWMTSEIDVQRMSELLGNVVKSKLMEFKAMNHIDFIWSVDVDTLIFNEVLEFMLNFK